MKTHGVLLLYLSSIYEIVLGQKAQAVKSQLTWTTEESIPPPIFSPLTFRWLIREVEGSKMLSKNYRQLNELGLTMTDTMCIGRFFKSLNDSFRFVFLLLSVQFAVPMHFRYQQELPSLGSQCFKI